MAWLLVRRIHDRVKLGSVWYGERGIDGVLFPVLALAFALFARWLLGPALPLAVFKLAVPILASLAVIRTAARVIGVAFPGSALVRTSERTVSWLGSCIVGPEGEVQHLIAAGLDVTG